MNRAFILALIGFVIGFAFSNWQNARIDRNAAQDCHQRGGYLVRLVVSDQTVCLDAKAVIYSRMSR